MRRWIAIAALISAAGAASPASARPLAEALARHTEADVAALRARRSDVAARCTLGAVYARRSDLPRAALYLAGCDLAELPADIAGDIVKLARDLRHRLDRSPLARLEILSRPEGLAAEIDDLRDEPLTTPATVWVAPGPHTIHVHAAAIVTREIVTEPHKDALVMIEADAAPPPPRTQTLDLGQDDTTGALGEEHTAPPPDLKHPSLIQGKYAGVADPSAGPAIDDPLAVRPPSTGPIPAWSLGLRLGAGIFDDAAASARAGLSVAVAARIALPGPWLVAARLDATRRGGDPVNVLGAAAGLGVAVFGPPLGHRALGLALLAQLRGDLRLDASRGDAPVHRAGLSIAFGPELSLPGTPLSAGLRVEQGLTPLVPGARDRAAIVELGLDLR